MRDSKRNVRICASVGRWSEWVGAGGVLSPGSAGGGGGAGGAELWKVPPKQAGGSGGGSEPPVLKQARAQRPFFVLGAAFVLAAFAFYFMGKTG